MYQGGGEGERIRERSHNHFPIRLLIFLPLKDTLQSQIHVWTVCQESMAKALHSAPRLPVFGPAINPTTFNVRGTDGQIERGSKGENCSCGGRCVGVAAVKETGEWW